MKALTLLESVWLLSRRPVGTTGDTVAPVAVLWTDADGQWQPVVDQLRGYAGIADAWRICPQTHRSAIWLKCVIGDRFEKTISWYSGRVTPCP